jgi:molybdopterin converting factor subunit 1
MSAMRVEVKLFAVARQRTGCSTIEVDLPAGSTVAALRAAIVKQHPALADLLPHARLAIDSEYASDAQPIPPAAEIAIIPPVSGG